jgi:hypothetical protein
VNRSHPPRSNGGFALPAAVFALVIAAALIVGSTFVARQELRIGTAIQQGTEAFYLAERGMNEVMTDWPAATMTALPLWDTTSTATTFPDGIVSTRVTRLGARLYLLESSSLVTRGGTELQGAARETGSVVRLFSVEIEPPAALTTRGTTQLKGTAEVHGEDVNPSVWPGLCSSTPTDKPGILTNDASAVSTSGAGEITGNPGVAQDTTISDETFREFGELDWDELTSLANKKLTPGNINTTGPVTVGSVCSTDNPLNWGDPLDPTAPCGNYFPIIHIPGSAKIQSGGVGQGILLVDGNLDLRGNFVFFGIVIVQGSISTQGSGNRVYGGVLASNADLDTETITGGSVITYSTCAAERAVMNNANLTRPRPLANRSWVDLSMVKN